jgi:hypothetical protein
MRLSMKDGRQRFGIARKIRDEDFNGAGGGSLAHGGNAGGDVGGSAIR